MERRTIDELERRLQNCNAELQAANEQLAQEASRRERVEGLSREWEERYRSLVENVPDVILVVDRAGEILSGHGSEPQVIGRAVAGPRKVVRLPQVGLVGSGTEFVLE